MFTKKNLRQKGFTLMEMVVVLTIIGILMGISLFPYNSYMEQARLNNYLDSFVQEWVLSHKQVRNGLLFPESNSHARLIWRFDEKNNTIDLYATKQKEEEIKQNLQKIESSPDFKKIKEFHPNNKIHFLGSDFDNNNEGVMYYIITPPHAEGKFDDESSQKTILFGYKDAKNADSPRIKKLQLRPYLQ